MMVMRYTPGNNGLAMRIMLVCINIAYIPVPLLFTRKVLSNRSIHIDRIIAKALTAVFLTACCFSAILLYIDIEPVPYRKLGLFFLLYLVVLPLSWTIFREIMKYFRRRGYNYLKVVIIGTGSTAAKLVTNMEENTSYGYRIVGFFSPYKPADFKGNYQGTIDDLEAFVQEYGVDEIYYTLSGEDRESLAKVLKVSEDNMVKFYYVPQINRYFDRIFNLTAVGTTPVLATHPTAVSVWYNKLLKRTFDITFSSAVLICSPIIFVPVAIAIKLSSPGPVFFRQKRTGYHGKDFTCYKFRTMKVNKDSDRLQATKNDPRKTRLGEFLRKTSIDELPQFFNVLRGDMSVVGPRPHMLRHTEQYTELIDQYMVRHIVPPGITGWAQVTGFRGETKELWQMQGRVERDVWYIEHWTFLLDLKIIVLTVLNAIRGEKNAF
ncbi:MAG: undecaprenyl-phosphate glucose phosphotransferase [Muribaculaceae bacterium]|nr:undecaprenyl-phosphate glucose phosphotransferase [Muribaculaceae bacterium]